MYFFGSVWNHTNSETKVNNKYTLRIIYPADSCEWPLHSQQLIWSGWRKWLLWVATSAKTWTGPNTPVTPSRHILRNILSYWYRHSGTNMCFLHLNCAETLTSSTFSGWFASFFMRFRIPYACITFQARPLALL